jgi:D-cysteine desulfhydrase family pyridoxal phosphate-dependent enzyme
MLERFARLNLGLYPTPIEEMPRLRTALGGGPKLYIKREDYSGPGFGGNKVRKLEYVLAAAIANGADTVLTIGGVRSNHARVTAALAARLGLECHLILNGTFTETPASIYLDQLYGAIVHRVPDRTERVPAMQRVAKELLDRGRQPFEIPLGASTPLGALGFVRAAKEIAGHGIHFNSIFHSTSSGGTQAGLAAGLQLFGMNGTRLIGVSADDPAASIAAHVTEIVAGIGQLLEKKFDPMIEVDDRFTGPGYGVATAEGLEAIDLLGKHEGIVLDPVYTSKAMAALIARIRNGEFSEDQSILFLHTGGQLALFSADIPCI